MKYMLDTNICSYIIKNRPLEVLKKFNTLSPEDYCISSITHAELKYWTSRNNLLHKKSKNHGSPKINEQVINNFIAHLRIVEFDLPAGNIYGNIRAYLEDKGITAIDADLLIGAHAISLNSILVTNNFKDFVNFPDIRLENWVDIVNSVEA